MVPWPLPAQPEVNITGERDIVDNGVERPWGDDGYSELITFVSSLTACLVLVPVVP